MINARPYQTDLIDRAREAMRRHRRVVIVSPTGSGKTVCFAIITTAASSRGKRVYIAAHRAEIVDQISAALDRMGVRHGRIQPSHTMTGDLVQVAMIQTLARRLDKIAEPDLFVIDECHHAISSTYATITEAWQRTRILGVTATPERMDGKGLIAAFDDIVIGPTPKFLISEGFLSGYEYLAPPQIADFSAVKTVMGDYAINDLAAAVDKAVITGDAIGHYRMHLDGRPAVAFCATVAHAEHVAAEFCAAGYRAASVDGAMDKSTRRDRLASIGDGRLHVLTSCELISEGVDVPVIAGAILLRPTKSLAMFLQQIGRVLRPKPDGSRAVILDHVGNVHRFGLPDAPREWSLEGRKKRDTAGSVHQCKQCYRVFSGGSGWQDDAVCGGDRDAPDCILTAKPEAVRAPMEQIDGTLERVTVDTTPDWAQGIDVLTAKGDQWKRLMRLARTHDQLREVARIRGYKPSWVHFVQKQRDDWKRARDAVPFRPDPAPVPVFTPPPQPARVNLFDV